MFDLFPVILVVPKHRVVHIILVRIQVLTAAVMKVPVFWDVAQHPKKTVILIILNSINQL
jgi:hypothetical protein